MAEHIGPAQPETLEAYLRLMGERPELFRNPAGAAVEILVEPGEMRAAQTVAARKLAVAGKPESWAEIGVVFRDQYIMVLRDAVRFRDGSLGTYIRTMSSEAGAPGVVILPEFDARIVLTRHFRHASRAWHIEAPRGFGSAGSTPEDDARREVAEEIAGVCGSIVFLGRVYPDSGLEAGPVHLFYAELTALGSPEAIEGIDDLLHLTPAELDRMIANDDITDGFTLAAYAKAKARGVLP